MPVHDRVKQHAQNHPDKTAVNIDGQTLSWQQLWHHALALYKQLGQQPRASGIVAIATGNHLAFPVAWLAATAQPYTAAIIDPQTPVDPLRDMLVRLQPDLLLLTEQDGPLIALAETLSIRWLALDRWQPEAELAEEGGFCAQMQAETPFLINFTSGTTSLPKAFIRSRRSWRCSFENGEAIFQLAAAPSTLFPGPLSHGIGLYCLNETLYAGGTFYSPGPWRPAAVLALIAAESIERIVLVPTMIAGLARVNAGERYPHLRSLVSAGAKLELNHYRQARALFPGARMQEYYGASELGFVAVSTLDDDNIADSLTNVGHAFPGTEITIRDDDGNRLPPGEVGTIWLSSEQIIARYLWGDEGNAFHQQGNRATVADIGYLDDRQRLTVIGRRGNMILSGGNNIYLSEVESVIKSLPGVIEAVVIAVDDAYLGKKMVAIVEADDDTCRGLAQQCRERLAKYKRPRQFYRIRRWPLTPGGKIKYNELEKRIAGHAAELTELSAAG